ncbi:MAG: prepilin-type N-terminal cleavage/methylation domain-containing protein [Minisyncoccia bacterium]
MKQSINKEGGFTLIEAMVAVTILALSVSGPLFMASRALVAAETARDQFTASYLAQEGVEYVRALRDDEYLKVYTGNTVLAWGNFMSSVIQCRTSPDTTAACDFDPAIPSLAPCTRINGQCTSPLYLSNGIYTPGITTGVKTSFTRTIKLVDINANDEKIVSTVSWSFHEIPYSVTVIDHLTPWQ